MGQRRDFPDAQDLAPEVLVASTDNEDDILAFLRDAHDTEESFRERIMDDAVEGIEGTALAAYGAMQHLSTRGSVRQAPVTALPILPDPQFAAPEPPSVAPPPPMAAPTPPVYGAAPELEEADEEPTRVTSLISQKAERHEPPVVRSGRGADFFGSEATKPSTLPPKYRPKP